MADIAQVYNIEVKNNDYFKGVMFTFAINGSPLDLTGYSARLHVRKTWDEYVIISLSTGNGLTITDAVSGKLSIDAQTFCATPGIYKYDLELRDGSGHAKTYVKGSFTVYEDITHD